MNKLVACLGVLGVAGAIGSAGVREGFSDVVRHAPPPPFAEFPVGVPKTVQFRVDDPELDSLSAREQADQRRDWLLFATLRSSGIPADSLEKATFDLPPARYGFIHGVANFEYGVTRSVYAGNGLVVALVPAGATREQRLDDLARVADRHRAELGEIPDSVVAFEYALDPSGDSARLTRTATLRGRDLFTPASGYREARVAALGDLDAFMRGIDDLTYARLDGQALVLGGRKVLGAEYRGIGLEDVAALWRSEQKVQQRRVPFEAQWKRREEAFDARWSRRTYTTQAERRALEAQQRRELDSLAFLYQKQAHDEGIVPGSGFSLDPVYDYDGLGGYFDRMYWVAAGLGAGRDSATIRKALAAHDEGPFLAWLGRMPRGDVAARILRGSDAFRFQAARYDGELRGTRVGMVLFYTDLLAKLWGFDYMGSAPGQAIPDFKASTQHALSPIYRRQLDSLNSTRLWFGPRDAAFQVGADARSLFFARGVTRVYAASASEYTPGAEAPANALSEAFIGWWNDHYDEIARYEPAYERLNEIMKWSLLSGWLSQSSAAGRLGFLASVPVDTTLWFPDWARSQPGLRFNRWDSVGFHPRGYRGSTTEAMPLLTSKDFLQFGEVWFLSGGVSLASRETFVRRAPLSRRVSPLLRRPTLEYRALDAASGELRTMDGLRYRFRAPGGGPRSVVVSPARTTRFRGSVSELAPADVERTFTREGTSLHSELKTGEMPLGGLDVRPSSGGGMQVTWRGRDMADAQSLARRMSASPGVDVDALIRSDDRIMAAYRVDDGHLVQFEGSSRWVKIVPGRAESVEVPAGFHARVAAPQGQPLQLRWLRDAEAQAEIAAYPRVVLKAPGTSPLGLRIPPGRLPRELHTVDRLLKAGDDRLALAELDRLPPAYRDVPEVAMRRAVAELGQGDAAAAASALRQAGPLPPASAQAFYDEINAWKAVDPARGDVLEQVARDIDARRASAARMVEGDLTPVAEGDRVVLHYAVPTPLSGEVTDLRKVLEELEERGALLYVQDSPGLNNLDFSPGALQQTLTEAVSARRGTLRALPRADLAHFRPSEVYATPQPQLRYRLQTDAHPRLSSAYRAWTPRPNCPEDRRDSDCPSVYVLTAP